MDDIKKTVTDIINANFPAATTDAGQTVAQSMVDKIIKEALNNPATQQAGINKLKSIVSELKGKELGETVTNSIISGIKSSLLSPVTQSSIIEDVTRLFGVNAPEIEKKAKEAYVKYSSALKNASAAIGLDAGFFEKAFEDPLGSLKTAVQGTDITDLMENALGRKFYQGVADNAAIADQKLNGIIGNIDKYRKVAAGIAREKINPFASFGKDESGKDVFDPSGMLDGFEKEFSENAIDLALALNIDTDDARAGLNAAYKGLTNFAEQSADLEIKTDFGKPIKGINALVVTAKAFGMTVEEITKKADDMGARFGVKSSDIIGRFEMMAKAGAKAGIAPELIIDTVMEAASGFADLGDATEESAAMLERFLDPKNPQRMKMQIEAYKNAAQGISKMTDNMKAFVGMGTEIAGGGGAIESIMRLDAAIKSGDQDALQEIFDQAISRIESITGAPMMTLQEAVDTGQEQVAYQQMQMLQQMGLATSRGQASEVVEAYRRGGVGVEGLRSLGGGPGLMETAVSKEGAGRGFFDRAGTQAQALADRESMQLMFKTKIGGKTMAERGMEMGEGVSDIGRLLYGVEDAAQAMGSDDTATLLSDLAKRRLASREKFKKISEDKAEAERRAQEGNVRARSGATTGTVDAAALARSASITEEQSASADTRTSATAEAMQGAKTNRDTAQSLETSNSRVTRTTGANAIVEQTKASRDSAEMRINKIIQLSDKNAQVLAKSSNDIANAADRVYAAALAFEKATAKGVQIGLSDEARKTLNIESIERMIKDRVDGAAAAKPR